MKPNHVPSEASQGCPRIPCPVAKTASLQMASTLVVADARISESTLAWLPIKLGLWKENGTFTSQVRHTSRT